MADQTKNTLGVKGGYSLAVHKADGTEVKEKRIPFSQNIVTHYGVQELIFAGFLNEQCVVGVGMGTAELTKDSLDLNNRIAETGRSDFEDISHSVSGGVVISKGFRRGSFPIGTFDGDIISEVGIHHYFSDKQLYAGQLIKDENGDPTTITILSDEQLSVEYVIQLDSSAEHEIAVSGTMDINGESVDYSIRVNPYFHPDDRDDGSYRNILKHFENDMFQVVSSNYDNLYNVDSSDIRDISRVDSTYTYHFNYTIPPDSFSSDDIKYIMVGASDGFWVSSDVDSKYFFFILEFDPPIQKTDTQAFTVDFEVTVEVTQDGD